MMTVTGAEPGVQEFIRAVKAGRAIRRSHRPGKEVCTPGWFAFIRCVRLIIHDLVPLPLEQREDVFSGRPLHLDEEYRANLFDERDCSFHQLQLTAFDVYFHDVGWRAKAEERIEIENRYENLVSDPARLRASEGLLEMVGGAPSLCNLQSRDART